MRGQLRKRWIRIDSAYAAIEENLATETTMVKVCHKLRKNNHGGADMPRLLVYQDTQCVPC